MIVAISPERCTGHGRCYALAAEVFSSDDDGKGVVRFENGVVPVELEAKAVLAERNCPETAVTCS